MDTSQQKSIKVAKKGKKRDNSHKVSYSFSESESWQQLCRLQTEHCSVNSHKPTHLMNHCQVMKFKQTLHKEHCISTLNDNSLISSLLCAKGRKKIQKSLFKRTT